MPNINVTVSRRKKYTVLHFFFDFFMVCITGGLWLLWLLFKFLRTA